MTKEEFRKKINDSDMTLLTNFDKYWELIKDKAEKCKDIELHPGKLNVGKNKGPEPGYIKFV